MDVVAQMKKFVEPKSVAIVGVPRSPMVIHGMAIDVLTNLINYGYQGKIYPIHPKTSEVRGLKTYATIADAPGDIDLAVINLPRELVPGVVKECVDKGIKAVTIVTQGFTDADDEKGKQLQREIDEVIRGTDTKVLGPNTFGTANAYIKFSSSYAAAEMEEVPVGLVCQSGPFFAGVGNLKLLGKGIDLGNGTDIHFGDALEYFEQDADTKVLAMHIEGMKDASGFLKQVGQVARKKPVVVLKTGRTEQGARAAQSHTGSLTGKNEIWDAAFKQAGVIKVNDVEEFGDTVKAFYTLPLMKGRRIGVVTTTGGFGVMGVDACQRSGLEVAKLSPTTVNRLSAIYPSWQNACNPADVWPASLVGKKPLFEVLDVSVRALLDDLGVDAVLCITGAVFTHDLLQLIEGVTKSHPDKPLVFCLIGPCKDGVKNKLEGSGNILTFSSPDRAIMTLGHLADYSESCVRC